ncbi:unnamed protein product [Anisakis simplex]|uniref:G-protein-signaling modulator 2 n=1 Tax=Anisakis simplex TaxID=6269 RepID=A0A0M3JT27_ANISI|nr:unnamed protein product [Anisakis simplex]
MSVPLAIEGMDALALAQEGERLCREYNFKAGIKYLELALEKKIDLGADSVEAVSAIYSQLGNAYFGLRNFQKALEYHQLDLKAAKFLNDRNSLARAYGNISTTYKTLGDFDSAYDNAVVHLKVARELNDKDSEARALFNIGSIYQSSAKSRVKSVTFHRNPSRPVATDNRNITSDLHMAIDCYLQNLKIIEAMDDLAACGRTYGNIGNSYYMLGAYETAIEYHNKRLEIARQFGDRAAMKRAYTNLGNAHIFLSQNAKALEYYRLALSMATELCDEVSEAQCCFSLGSASAISKDFLTAVEYHTRHLKLARKLGDRCGEARACLALAEVYTELGQIKKAIYFYILNIQLSVEVSSSNFNYSIDFTRVGDHSSEVNTRLAVSDMIKNINAANDDNNDTVNDEGAATDNNDSDDISKRSCAPSVSSTRKECHLDDIIDSSGDPSPQPLNRLSVSLQSLLFTDRNTNNDCGLSRNTAINTSTSTLNDLQRPSVITLEDDFFDMLTRMQSKRINEQRCDPNILTDLTNRSKGIARQSDSLVCGAEDSTERQKTRNRLSVIFGRVSEAARHTLRQKNHNSANQTKRSKHRQRTLSASSRVMLFDPTKTSTPRLVLAPFSNENHAANGDDFFMNSNVSANDSMNTTALHSHSFVLTPVTKKDFKLKSSSTKLSRSFEDNLDISSSSSSQFATHKSTSEIRTDLHQNQTRFSKSRESEQSEAANTVTSTSEPNTGSKEILFRRPLLPPARKRDQRIQNVSGMNVSSFNRSTTQSHNTPSVPNKRRNGAEDMLDLIESLQGRRMEEQRAHLSVNAESVSVSESGTDEPKETSDEIRKSERSKSEDAHSLYEMLLRSQSDRINEQRSELPNTIPDEDISQIVITMQKGRIETQRAQLKPTSE